MTRAATDCGGVACALPGLDRAQAQRIMTKRIKPARIPSPPRRRFRQTDGGLNARTLCRTCGADQTKNNKTHTIMTTLELKATGTSPRQVEAEVGQLTIAISIRGRQQDELAGRIQKATGETREAVEKVIKESSHTAAAAANKRTFRAAEPPMREEHERQRL